MTLIKSTTKPTPELPWQQAPLLRFALLIMLGIGMAWTFRHVTESIWWMGATACLALLSVISWELPYCKKHGFRTCAIIAASATLALASGTLALLEYEKTVVTWPVERQMWTATVKNIHRYYDNGSSLDVEINHSNPQWNHHCIRARVEGNQEKCLSVGSRISFYAIIQRPQKGMNPGDFDYDTYLITHGLSGTAYLNDSSWVALAFEPPHTIVPYFLNIRQKLVAQYGHFFTEEYAGILAALTLGDKSSLSDETRELFSDTGASHVLALSGLHLGILFSLLNLFFLRWFKRRKLFILVNGLAIVFLWLFVCLAGAPLSLQRATWMYTLMQVGVCLQRTRNASLNNLCLAAIVLLIFSPLSLFDVGFQLSFAAVLSILLCQQYVCRYFTLPEWKDDENLSWLGVLEEKWSHQNWKIRRMRIIHFLKKHSYLFFKTVFCPFVTVSLSAQWGTAGLIIYYFHQFSPYALLANFIVIPATYLLLSGALLFFLLPFAPIRMILAYGMKGLIQIMTDSLERLSLWPGASISLYPSVFTLFVLTLLPLFVYLFVIQRRRKIRVRLIYATSLLILLAIGNETYYAHEQKMVPQLIVYRIPQTTVIHFIVSTDESYLYSSVSQEKTEEKITYLKKNFFTPNRIKPPLWITNKNFSNQKIYRKNEVFVFGNKELILLNHKLPSQRSTPYMDTDVLLVSRGCRDSLKTVWQSLHPRKIVLDHTLSNFRRKQWKRDCNLYHIPCHDIREEGAFILKLK